MKKFILLIVFMLSIFVLVSCGKKNSGSSSGSPTFGGLVSATAIASDEVLLTWNAATSTSLGNINYLVYASMVGTDPLTVPFITTSKNSFTVNGLDPWTAYTFLVRASDEAGNMDTNLVTKEVVTLSQQGSAYYSYAIGTPEGFATSGYHLVGVISRGDISSLGIADSNGSWTFCYSNDTTIEGVSLDSKGRYIGMESGSAFNDLFFTFSGFMDRTGTIPQIDSDKAMKNARADSRFQSWISSKSENDIINVMTLSYQGSQYSKVWFITFDYKNLTSLVMVTIDAMTGQVLNYEET